MARNENLPFEQGATFYNGGTIDSNNLGGTNLEGMEFVVEDFSPSTGVVRTGMYRRLRIVRNVSGVALLPKMLVRFDTTAGKVGTRVIGYARTTAAEGYPVDEYLPTAGCPNNDLCYIVIEGPATVITQKAAGAPGVIGVNSWVVASTAAASTHSTTAGRVEVQDLTGATALLADQVQNRVGRALSAKTTANTDADLLIACGHW